MRDSLPTRIARRLARGVEWAFLRLVGRQLICAECGRRLLVAFPVVWRGRVRVIGAREYNVRVSFRDKTSLEFRHMELDQCPAPERPWVT
ncbi:MAG: hypothetical protein QOK25_2617 [Thermoleophilaceae bacterium]|nr:hypothetical protein [Thermoleophilaceae bacterium]